MQWQMGISLTVQTVVCSSTVLLQLTWKTGIYLLCWFHICQVVEELLSRSGALEKETAKSIADAAMLEVASISMGHMVRQLSRHRLASSRTSLCNVCNLPLSTGAR